MSSPAGQPEALEVAQIVRAHGAEFLARYTTSSAQRRVLRDLACCRTAALGGHIERCDQCPHERAAYNSCRNRHCPKCQGSVAAQWMRRRADELLNVPYFHVVFTLPDSVAALALQNPRLVYGFLFEAAARTLLEVAANPQQLGAQIGFLAVLHTWGQNLQHHPHLHCVVPAGGLSPCGTKWISAGGKFFLPVRVLSRVFRGKFVALLKQAHRRGQLQLHGQLAPLAQHNAWQQWLRRAVRQEWVVYAKAPFGGPEVVLKYLARYTHRVAISNRRLLHSQHGRVTFRVKDYAAGGRRGTVTLDATEFLRRFLLHVLPKGFVRIRHFGFLANRFRTSLLNRCRELLHMDPRETAVEEAPSPQHSPATPSPAEDDLCPACRRGRLHTTRILRQDRPHGHRHRVPRKASADCDTS